MTDVHCIKKMLCIELIRLFHTVTYHYIKRVVHNITLRTSTKKEAPPLNVCFQEEKLKQEEVWTKVPLGSLYF